MVRTKVNNNVLHGFHGFSKFNLTNAVMFSVSKDTDEISCFSLFWCCDCQEHMPYTNRLSSKDDIGNFVVSLDTWDIELLISKKLSQPNYGLSDTVIVTGFVISGIFFFFYDIC